MDAQAESSEHARRPNTHRHATFDLAESPSRVPPEGGTEKEQSHRGETSVHFSENLDDQKGGIKRSSTHLFPSPEGRGATSEPVRFKTAPLQYGHKRNKERTQSKSKIFAYRSSAGRIKIRSSPLPRHHHHRGSENRDDIVFIEPPHHRTQSSDNFRIEDTDSDILSADEDSASDAMASSSLDFDFSSFASGPETQDEAEIVPEAPLPRKPSIKESEMYNETIHKILISGYRSSTSRRSDSTAELLVDLPIGTQNNQSGYLMRWMYVLLTIRPLSRSLITSY